MTVSSVLKVTLKKT